MTSPELIKIDYSSCSEHGDIVHAKIIKNLDEAIDQMKKNEIKLKINDRKFSLCQNHTERSLPTLKLKKLDDNRYRADYKNRTKLITDEIENHNIREIIF